MNNIKIFTDLFGRQFTFADKNFNKDEFEVYKNLNTNWTLVSIFPKEGNKTYLIEYMVHLLRNEFPYEKLISHENDVMTLLIYKGKLSNSQKKLIQELKDNAEK